MQAWEYKTVKFDRKGVFKAKFNPDDELNTYGAEGWEVVTSYTAGAGATSSNELFVLMKRPK